jgi:hypothetical protein
VLQRLRQEDHELKLSLGYIVRHYLIEKQSRGENKKKREKSPFPNTP